MISLNGEAEIMLECGIDAYEEPGATAFDSGRGDVAVAVRGDTVNTQVPGTYVVTYDAVDQYANYAERVTRTVRVVADDGSSAASAGGETPQDLCTAFLASTSSLQSLHNASIAVHNEAIGHFNADEYTQAREKFAESLDLKRQSLAGVSGLVGVFGVTAGARSRLLDAEEAGTSAVESYESALQSMSLAEEAYLAEAWDEGDAFIDQATAEIESVVGFEDQGTALLVEVLGLLCPDASTLCAHVEGLLSEIRELHDQADALYRQASCVSRGDCSPSTMGTAKHCFELGSKTRRDAGDRIETAVGSTFGVNPQVAALLLRARDLAGEAVDAYEPVFALDESARAAHEAGGDELLPFIQRFSIGKESGYVSVTAHSEQHKIESCFRLSL